MTGLTRTGFCCCVGVCEGDGDGWGVGVEPPMELSEELPPAGGLLIGGIEIVHCPEGQTRICDPGLLGSVTHT